MAILIAIPILSLLLILQSAIFSQVPLLRGTSDLVMLAVLAWALQKRVQTAIHWSVIAGLLVSLASALPLGAALVSYPLAAGLALVLRQRIWQVPILAMFVATFFGTLIVQGISFFMLRLLGVPLPWLETFNLIVLPSILLNLLLAIPIYAILGDLAKWFYPEELEV